jgi:serine/threonine protein kinase
VQLESDSTCTDQVGAPEGFPLPSLGAVVDERYRITRCIGTGGMGAVFEAEQLSVGRRCALKFLRAELAGASRSTARFLRESRLLGKLEHEHLTAVLDAGTYLGKSPYLVMEYLEGRTLRQVLAAEGSLSVEATLDIMLQVCRGMAYVHAQGIVHRDLKPANLMVIALSSGRPWVKILDFGIARESNAAHEHLTPSGADLGTAHYMSPEQARGAKDLDYRSDVYALGTIMYEALTGSRLHVGDSYNAVIFHLLTQPHRPLEELMPAGQAAVVTLVERCLQKEPARRFADAGELAEALNALSLVPPASAGSSPRKASGRAESGAPRRWYAWSTCLLAGSLIGSLVTLGTAALFRPTSEARQTPSRENASAGPVMSGQVPSESVGVRVVPEPSPTPTPAGSPTSSLRTFTGEEEGVKAATRESPTGVIGARLRRDTHGAIGPSSSMDVVGTRTLPTHVPNAAPGEPPAIPSNETPRTISTDADAHASTDQKALEPAAVNLPAGDPFPFVTSNPYGAN